MLIVCMRVPGHVGVIQLNEEVSCLKVSLSCNGDPVHGLTS
jgi:hypothetical protein